jgi:hypothetical protein
VQQESLAALDINHDDRKRHQWWSMIVKLWVCSFSTSYKRYPQTQLKSTVSQGQTGNDVIGPLELSWRLVFGRSFQMLLSSREIVTRKSKQVLISI